MNLNHKGRAKDNVNTIWLVDVKTYGNRPMKLLNKINENSEIRIKVLPWDFLLLIKTLNSLCSVNKILFHSKLSRDGINQKVTGIIKIPKMVLIQLKDELKLVDGSKDENKLVIIFSWLKVFSFFLKKI